MRLTVVAPHPDDELIGCGGTVAKMIAAGCHASVVWVAGRDEIEHAEAVRAAKKLGFQEMISLGFDEFGLSYGPEPLRAMVRALRQLRPEALFIPHADEDDRQHQVVHAVADEAGWLAAYPRWPELGSALPQRPGLVFEYEVWTPIARPTHFEDITGTIESKLESLRLHGSQLAVTALDVAVEGLNRYRGEMGLGVRYAEAFKLRLYGRSVADGTLSAVLAPSAH